MARSWERKKRSIYLFPSTAITNYQNLVAYKTEMYSIIVLGLRSVKSSVARDVFHLKSLRGNFFLASPSFWWLHNSNLCLKREVFKCQKLSVKFCSSPEGNGRTACCAAFSRECYGEDTGKSNSWWCDKQG